MPKYYKARSGNFYKIQKDNHPIYVRVSKPASIAERVPSDDYYMHSTREITEEEFLSACRDALMNMGLGKVLSKDKK